MQDLASLRFALSPVWEIVASVRVLKDPAAHALHVPWVKQVRRRLSDLEGAFPLLSALVPVPTRVLPGFLAATPASPLPDVEAEIDAVCSLDHDEIRTELATMYGSQMPPPVGSLHHNPGLHLPRLMDQMHRYWQDVLAPDWPRVRGLLEGDLMYRAQRLADGGPRLLFADLDPTITWSNGILTIQNPTTTADHRLGGRGLVVVPSAFTWPRVFVKVDERWPPVLRYPARGVGTLWEQQDGTGPDIAAVVGRARARVLRELAAPASTSELARRTGLASSGVSTHLSRLRTAGLVDSHRTGRVVLYARTPRADALIADDAGPTP
ncbi:MAG: DUF5937 family protein [Nocardioidaceae bacterium]